MKNKVRCECCDRHFKETEIQVRASMLGPTSFRSCNECIKNECEPEWIIKYKLDEGLKISGWLKELTVFKKDEYFNLDIYARVVELVDTPV